jgi:hypothetical protein
MPWQDAGVPAETRLWKRVEKTAYCWNWTGHLSGGYGRIRIGGGRSVQVHRFAYELAGGRIPDGYALDHLCRNNRCVRPSHCEPVTNQVNVIMRGTGPLADQAKQTHCRKAGHPLTGQNLYRRKSGKRECRACKRENARAWDQANIGKVNRQKRERYHRRKASKVR